MEKRKRSVFVSILFSIISPGLGHMYCGYIKFGIGIVLSYIFLSFLLLEVGIGSTFTGLMIFFTLHFLFYIYVIYHATKLAKDNTDYLLKRFNRPGYYILWLILFYFLTPYMTDIYRIEDFRITTSAMESTLQIGDHIYVDKRVSYDEIKAGDVIVFEYPFDRNLYYIKRCLAVGGDEVEIIDKKVYLNRKGYDESLHVRFVENDTLGKNGGRYRFPTFEGNKYGSRDNFGPIGVPNNNFFVLGDNRDRSSDSRIWGFVPANHLVGKALYIYLSYDQKNMSNNLLNSIRFSRIGKTLN